MEQKKIFFTERQLRFMEAIRLTGRGGTDRSDIVRRALDAWIELKIKEGLVSDADGGDPEPVTPER